MSLEPNLWKGQRVLVTGHTGFKGTWLTFWLAQLGAQVMGYSLPPDKTTHRLFHKASPSLRLDSRFGDVRDFSPLLAAAQEFQPQLVLHLAAQALVRQSYREPLETYSTNVMGTAHVLEVARQVSSVTSVVVVTTDKCYENREWVWPYREIDPLGGHDPYSNSKACAELVTEAYRRSFLAEKGVLVASARAGNVIGGGDLSEDRLIPDAIRAFRQGQAVEIRSPQATRPWQHVLDPLHGYLLLAQKLLQRDAAFAEAFNFGPSEEHTVATVMDHVVRVWGQGAAYTSPTSDQPHEAGRLHLDSRKAQHLLRWIPQFGFEESLDRTVNFYRLWDQGECVTALMADDLQAHQAFSSRSHP